MTKQNLTDWSVPQRQPVSALFILVIQTFWEVVRRVWPFLLIPIVRGMSNSSGRTVSRLEYFALAILVITLIGGLLKYLFFRFYLLNGELIVKRGWIKKQTIVIPLDKIQSVNLEQPLLHQALNLVKVTIDTAGSAAAEVSIDSLSKPMAEELRALLMEGIRQKQVSEEEITLPATIPVIRVGMNDLVRLSLSANHLETFALIVAFGFSLYDDLSEVSERFAETAQGLIPNQTLNFIVFLTVASLLVTIAISTVRIFLKFYNLTVYDAPSGFRITSGLTTLKERVITGRRIQFISWKANWIRQLLNLRVLRFHLAGDDTINESLKAELPITRHEFIDVLTRGYHPVPDTTGKIFLQIHRAYVIRTFLIAGIIPAAIVTSVVWYFLDERAFFILIYPLLVLFFSWLSIRKFRLYAFDEILFIEKGMLGKEQVLLKWSKLQSVKLKQSIYQRKKGLANIEFLTAGNDVMVKYIPLAAAQQLVNYAAYKIESSREPWM